MSNFVGDNVNIKSILIIGGTGVISTEFVNYAIEKGAKVHILNRGNRKDVLNENAILIQADIKDNAVVKEKIDNYKYDVVIDFISYNVNDLKNTLSIFGGLCKQFVFISSSTVYSNNENDIKITEDSKIGSDWSYANNKIQCELLLNDYCKDIDLNYTIIRPYVTYDKTRIPFATMPAYGYQWSLIHRLINNKPVVLWDGGLAKCSLIHSYDFAKKLYKLILNSNAYNEIFNIANSESSTWNEVLADIGKVLGVKPTTISIPSIYISTKISSFRDELLFDKSKDMTFNTAKITETIGDNINTINFEEGIRTTLDFMRENNRLNNIDYSWDAKMDKLILEYIKDNNLDVSLYGNLKFVQGKKMTNADNLVYFISRFLPLRAGNLINKFIRLCNRCF